MARGRPSLYDAAVHPAAAFKLALLGKTDKEIAANLAISTSTLHKWKKEHPRFASSLTRGKDNADADVAAGLYHRARGYSHEAVHIHVGKDAQGNVVVTKTPYTKHYPPDTMAAIYWLNNRQRRMWFQEQQRKPVDVTDPEETATSVADALREMHAIEGLGLPVVEGPPSGHDSP